MFDKTRHRGTSGNSCTRHPLRMVCHVGQGYWIAWSEAGRSLRAVPPIASS